MRRSCDKFTEALDRATVGPSVPCNFRTTNMAVLEGKKSSNDIINVVKVVAVLVKSYWQLSATICMSYWKVCKSGTIKTILIFCQ